MRRARTAAVVVWLALVAMGLEGQRQVWSGQGGASLGERVSEYLRQERFASASWGIKIVSSESGRTLFEHNAGKLLKPASNAKLFTGALALDRLGPDYRIKTSLYAERGPNGSGTLRSDLMVFGRGDPCFSARFHDGDYSLSLEPLVRAVREAGIKRIKGDLIGDESFFRGPPFGSGWAWEDLQYYYGARVSALTAEDNVMDLLFRPGPRVGEPCEIVARRGAGFLRFNNRTRTMEPGAASGIDLYRPVGEEAVDFSGGLRVGGEAENDAVAVSDPARWFLVLFKEALERGGIKVSGKPRTVDWRRRERTPLDHGRLVELASVESRPVSEILLKMMKPSQNLYAQLLLLQVGERSRSEGLVGQTTEELGLAELGRFLEEAGIPRREVLLEEGSGLSRRALLTANATVELLRHMDRHRWAEVYLNSLPVGGVDGSLRNRFKGTWAEGKVRAKTGTLRYVNSLSGYVRTGAGERLVFSIILNGYGEASARRDIDEIVLMMSGE